MTQNNDSTQLETETVERTVKLLLAGVPGIAATMATWFVTSHAFHGLGLSALPAMIAAWAVASVVLVVCHYAASEVVAR